MKPNYRNWPLVAALWVLFMIGGVVSGWMLWDRSLDLGSFGYYASEVLTNLPVVSIFVLASASLASAVGATMSSSRLLRKERSAEAAIACALLVAVLLGGNVGLWVSASPSPTPWNDRSCTYDVFLSGGAPMAWQAKGHFLASRGSAPDLGAIINSLPQTNQVICVENGAYPVRTGIMVSDQTNVTLVLSHGAVLTAVGPVHLIRLVRSDNVVVEGGRWVGPGFGNFSDIEIDRGSNHVTVEGVDASRAGHDGILVRNDTVPGLVVSILNNYLHGNLRFGAQDFENVTTQSLDVNFSGNRAVDNGVGGIYTNGVGGAYIVGNTVMNTADTGPGLIGIGVTNGTNDTIVGNHVNNMSEYGIQAFYNNYTLIANNYSGFNAGASDQSGITNDHSFYDTLVNNTVVSNGLAGIHVERSWYVTVKGNNATGNGRFGIEFYHGTLPTVAHVTVRGNTCSRNAQAGIILNSGVDSLISGNTCLDNSGPGVYLYNDQGQAGSSGNTISNNTLGDDRAPSLRTQTYGVEAVNGAWGNSVEGNVFLSCTVSTVSLVGQGNLVSGNSAPPG